MSVQGSPKERNSQSRKVFSSHLWTFMTFDHWPTHKCIRALRRAYLMPVRQGCLRVKIAHVRLHFPLTFWVLDLRRVSISFELKSFLLSTCRDALESIVDSRLTLEVLKWTSTLFKLRHEVKCIFKPLLTDPTRLCERITLVFEFRLVIFRRNWESMDVDDDWIRVFFFYIITYDDFSLIFTWCIVILTNLTTWFDNFPAL